MSSVLRLAASIPFSNRILSLHLSAIPDIDTVSPELLIEDSVGRPLDRSSFWDVGIQNSRYQVGEVFTCLMAQLQHLKHKTDQQSSALTRVVQVRNQVSNFLCERQLMKKRARDSFCLPL